MLLDRLCMALSVAAISVPASAQQLTIIPGIRASMRPVSHHVPMGQPVWTRFSIENVGDQPITLTVPGAYDPFSGGWPTRAACFQWWFSSSCDSYYGVRAALGGARRLPARLGSPNSSGRPAQQCWHHA